MLARNVTRRGILLPQRLRPLHIRAPTTTTTTTRSLLVRNKSHYAREPEAVPILQTITVDRLGRQRRVEYHHRPPPDDRSRMAKYAAGLVAAGACAALCWGDSSQSHAAAGTGSDKNDNSNLEAMVEEVKTKLQKFLQENTPLPSTAEEFQQQINAFLASGKGGQISWGFMMGVCSGFALKKISKVGAVALGTLFILLQAASYTGYIDVNHKKIERDVMAMLDVNKDGQFDAKDLDDVYKSLMKILEFSLPAGSGFAVGFMVGFRTG